MATRKKTYSLDERSIVQIEDYARQLHISSSAFVSLMVTQIANTMTMLDDVPYDGEEKRDTGDSGRD